MSMSTCKCGKVFDSDFQLGMDAQGNCACDNCEQKMFSGLIKDLMLKGCKYHKSVEIADHLMNMGYRKIK